MIPSPPLNHGGSIGVNTTVVHHSEMSREDPQFKLRLSEKLRDQITESAKASNRSMNAEIVARLEASYDQAESYSKSQAEEIVMVAVNYAVDTFADRLVKAGVLPKTDKGARSLLEELGTAKPKKAKEK